MRIQTDVPFALEDITPSWLTEALASQGLLKSAKVTCLDARVIGEETGFLGLVAILTPTYSSPEPGAPGSLILKIPTPLKNRKLGQSLGVYEKEIRFYRDLKPTLNVRTPAHYYSALDAFDDPEEVLVRLARINRLPMLLVALVALAWNLWVGLFPRHYVLLIEDLSHYRMGDQLAGCSREDAKCALTAMATLHAQFWNSEALDALRWIVPAEMTGKLIHLMYLQSIERYKKSESTTLSRHQLALIDWIKDHGIALVEIQRGVARTLLHGDFRLDNLCFDDQSGDALILDWQTMTTGSAGTDLAYFLSAALPFEAPESDVEGLIEYYRVALGRCGVAVSEAALNWQYEVGMLSMLHRVAPVMVQDHLELGEARGPELMQSWISKTFKRLERVDFETILERMPAEI